MHPEPAPHMPLAAPDAPIRVCPACLQRFTPRKPNQRFCVPTHKSAWDSLMREIGTVVAERIEALQRRLGSEP